MLQRQWRQLSSKRNPMYPEERREELIHMRRQRMIMGAITSYTSIDNEEEGRRVRGKGDLKVKTKVKVDREEKERTDLLTNTNNIFISSTTTTTTTTPLTTTTSLITSTPHLKANTSTSTPTTTTTKKPTIRKKKKMMKRRKTKNRVSSAQRRSNITLEVFVGTRLASEYTSDPWLSIVVVYVCRVAVSDRGRDRVLEVLFLFLFPARPVFTERFLGRVRSFRTAGITRNLGLLFANLVAFDLWSLGNMCWTCLFHRIRAPASTPFPSLWFES